jgi:hypothetical protein
VVVLSISNHLGECYFYCKEKVYERHSVGFLYNKYKDVVFDTKAIEEETARLIADDEVD